MFNEFGKFRKYVQFMDGCFIGSHGESEMTYWAYRPNDKSSVFGVVSDSVNTTVSTYVSYHMQIDGIASLLKDEINANI